MVSIVMPVYNGKDYICDAVDSVLVQTYQDYELIIVDDGSTDDTVDLIKNKYNDKRIRVITKVNGGPSSARNTGMRNAKGEYFAFIDCDDKYMPDKIKEQLIVMETYPEVDLIWTDYVVVDKDLKEITPVKEESLDNRREDLLAQMLFRNIISNPAAIMFRRKCFDEGYEYDETLLHSEDYDLLLRMLERFNFYHLDKILYMYRRHEHNLTNNRKDSEIAGKFVANKYSIDKIKGIIDKSSFNNREKKLLISKILLKQNYFQDALSNLEELEDEMKNNLVYFYMGVANYHLGNYIKAKEDWQKATILNKNFAEAYNNLGCCMGKLKHGNYEQMFIKAKKINSEYLDPQINLKKCRKCNTEFKITERELRKVVYSNIG